MLWGNAMVSVQNISDGHSHKTSRILAAVAIAASLTVTAFTGTAGATLESAGRSAEAGVHITAFPAREHCS